MREAYINFLEISMRHAYNFVFTVFSRCSMSDVPVENLVGALALGISDSFLLKANELAPEPGQAAALITLLKHEPGMTIEKLRRILGLSHPGAVRLVDRMIGQKVITKQKSGTDRRSVELYLSEEGERVCSKILTARHEKISQALTVLNEEELIEYGRLTDKLLKAFVQNETHAYSVCRLCDTDVCDNCPVESIFVNTSDE